MKVFICEDDSDIQELMEILLSDLGLHVETARNYHNILPELKVSKPDLLIIDYWLKDTKADKQLFAIKSESQFQSLPVILISAIDNLERVAKLLPVTDIIKKPFDIGQFQAKIQQTLSNYDQARSNN